MKKMMELLRRNQAVFYLIIFLSMILPSLFLFAAAENSNQTAIIFWTVLVILANLAAVLSPRAK